MRPTMPRLRLPIPAVLAVAALALAPVAASAGLHVDTFRGSHCNPSHFNGETEEWSYEGPNLVNRGSSAWDVLIASCPLHVAPPPSASSSVRILEIRVVVDNATYSNGWCNLHDVNSVERPLHSRSTNPEWFWWAPPSSWGLSQRDFTLECLVLPDWALERIEVVWIW